MSNDYIRGEVSKILVELDEVQGSTKSLMSDIKVSNTQYPVVIEFLKDVENWIVKLDALDFAEESEATEEANLEEKVRRLLVVEYDLSVNDADEMIVESCNVNPEIWNENAVAEDLAEYLVSDSDDELD